MKQKRLDQWLWMFEVDYLDIVEVINEDGERVAYYDGKSSIEDEQLDLVITKCEIIDFREVRLTTNGEYSKHLL
jgi:hypothetical protein